MKSDTPKVLHKVAGLPVLRWVVNAAEALNPDEVVAVVGHGADEVRKKFTDDKLTFVNQSPQLGTGHAVMQAAPQLKGFKGDVLVLAGDVPLLRHDTLTRLLKNHRDSKAKATVLTAKLPDPRGYGRIVRDTSGRVLRIVEQKDLSAEHAEIEEFNSGTYVFDAAALLKRLDKLTTNNAQKEYYLTDVIGLLCQGGQHVGATLTDAVEVQGINTRKDLALCDVAARSGILEDLMLNRGVTVLDPGNTYIEAGVEIGRDTIVYPSTVIHSGVVIGERCEIGPFAHIRGGTKVGNDCKIGAFVETKNAIYGDGAKSGHLAYMGDVTLGKNVNIGAGSIVANYDGKKKHKTQIGDGAFIGCGTVLVAPVKVGKNAQTGANTVVPRGKDVPDDTIVVGAPARVLRKKTSGE
ncbi:MAG: NTP transferase domain-containing protein [Planctomycetes bacterium]|nr:NTP transferase domain-containing protein [Planctomycetota bacterium]